jgi:hypothetical protein
MPCSFVALVSMRSCGFADRTCICIPLVSLVELRDYNVSGRVAWHTHEGVAFSVSLCLSLKFMFVMRNVR